MLVHKDDQGRREKCIVIGSNSWWNIFNILLMYTYYRKLDYKSFALCVYVNDVFIPITEAEYCRRWFKSGRPLYCSKSVYTKLEKKYARAYGAMPPLRGFAYKVRLDELLAMKESEEPDFNLNDLHVDVRDGNCTYTIKHNDNGPTIAKAIDYHKTLHYEIATWFTRKYPDDEIMSRQYTATAKLPQQYPIVRQLLSDRFTMVKVCKLPYTPDKPNLNHGYKYAYDVTLLDAVKAFTTDYYVTRQRIYTVDKVYTKTDTDNTWHVSNHYVKQLWVELEHVNMAVDSCYADSCYANYTPGYKYFIQSGRTYLFDKTGIQIVNIHDVPYEDVDIVEYVDIFTDALIKLYNEYIRVDESISLCYAKGKAVFYSGCLSFRYSLT